MNVLKNLRVVYKIGVFVVVAAVVMAIVGLTGYKSLQQSSGNMKFYAQRVEA